MKHLLSTVLGAFFLTGCLVSEKPQDVSQRNYDGLKQHFDSPEQIYGVNCWWWWLNGNVTRAAITKDLEAMKEKSFQGAMIFDAGGHNQRGNRDIPAGPFFGSPEWNDLFVFALDEARRLGLEIGFNIQSGWNLGGPCVTPRYAAKQLTYSETSIDGGTELRTQLPQPESRDDFYRDIAVLAFPADADRQTDSIIENLDYKLGFHELGGSAPDCRFLLENRPSPNRAAQTSEEKRHTLLIDPATVVDLTPAMDSTGVLTWNAPSGQWNILRIGYTCTRSRVSTSSNAWQGRVLDYMSTEAFDYYWQTVVDPILTAAGDHVGTTLKFMETDSWECGGMNWTDSFAEDFRTYCGYDPIQYLPLIAGHIVGSVEESDAFTADFRKTLAHLVAVNHYARFADHAHRHGMGIQPESAGPHAGPLDGIKNYGYSDIVMSEFWSPSPHRPRPQDRFFLKQASSAAHIYGKKIIGAESFTTIGPHWNDALWRDQKSAFDHEICAGLNRTYFHTFTCSPEEQGLPGQEYFAGTHVNPQVTWWNDADPFIDYLHRVQMIAQEGKFVADVLYYYGDHVPNVFPFKHSDPAGAMPGFDYDVTDETIFLQLDVDDGKIVVPSGLRYHILVLPDHRVLSLAVLEKLEKLVRKGAHVLGQKPLKAVSLVGGPDADKKFQKLADKIWGSASDPQGSHEYGKGRVSWGVTAREYLTSNSIPADFSIEGNDSKTDFDYIHYKNGTAHFYFVSNQTDQPQHITARFRIAGQQPELWDALSGKIRRAEAFSQCNSLTSVPLTLEPYGSIFVVFNEAITPETQGTKSSNDSRYDSLQTLTGSWSVRFDPAWGGPDSVVFPELIDWTTHSDAGIRYYSGTARYHKTFELTFPKEDSVAYFLQLEDVRDVGIARIRINGVDKGIVWTKPFRIEVTDELKEETNDLEISVTNSWHNRVAGDELFVSPKKYTHTNIVLGHDFVGRPLAEGIVLEPSGLLGPVTIRRAVEVQ